MIIGILALQGAFIEHKCILDKLQISNILIKYPEQIKNCDGIIIPGGESTAMSIIDTNVFEEIKTHVKNNKPIWGTCAGLILLSNEIIGKIGAQQHIGGLDVVVQRNFFGSQQQSFIKHLPYPQTFGKEGTFPAIFIRAPIIKEVYDNVKILIKCDDNIVAVQQNNLLGTSFHPELTEDSSWHKYFIKIINEYLKIKFKDK